MFEFLKSRASWRPWTGADWAGAPGLGGGPGDADFQTFKHSKNAPRECVNFRIFEIPAPGLGGGSGGAEFQTFKHSKNGPRKCLNF